VPEKKIKGEGKTAKGDEEELRRRRFGKILFQDRESQEKKETEKDSVEGRTGWSNIGEFDENRRKADHKSPAKHLQNRLVTVEKIVHGIGEKIIDRWSFSVTLLYGPDGKNKPLGNGADLNGLCIFSHH